MVEVDRSYASKGVAGTALGLGAGAIGLELLRGGFNGILGGNCGCNEDHTVNRYEAGLNSKIALLETEVKLRDANTYTDSKLLEMYRYVDGKFNGIEAQICQQSVVNAQVAANLSCLTNTVNTLSGLTKTIIPIDNVCPPPMERYNSWVAPTTAPTT